MMEPIFVKFAARYAAKGFPVFPLAEGSKVPTNGSNGFEDATTDPQKIMEMAARHPYGNIGLRTGKISRLTVIDVDPEKGGFKTAAEFLKQGKRLPLCPISQTRSGGNHSLLQYDPRLVTGSNRLGKGIDFRNDGAYIVAPPSVVDGKKYRWQQWPEAGPAPVPQWLIEEVESKKAQLKPRHREGVLSDHTPLPADLERARKALNFVPSDDRDIWLRVGIALSAFADDGRELWDLWSRQSDKFCEKEQNKAWHSFKFAGLSLGTIFHFRSLYRGRPPLYDLVTVDLRPQHSVCIASV
jgi:Bifunctional DNA primase/polymerase, N-terminal/Primase C terminal 2 (PriCT-2)